MYVTGDGSFILGGSVLISLFGFLSSVILSPQLEKNPIPDSDPEKSSKLSGKKLLNESVVDLISGLYFC